MMSRDLVAEDGEETDLIGLLRGKAVAACRTTLVGIGGTSLVGITVIALLSGGRFYLTLPFVAAACFAVYGLSAQRKTADADFSPDADPTVVMKGAELIGVVAAVEALLAFFFLVLGPSWTL